MTKEIACVVIPTFQYFLDVLVQRSDQFTTLVWPGFSMNARPMVGPHGRITSSKKNLIPHQLALPFLYRPISDVNSGQPFAVSHASLGVFMVHDEIYHLKSNLQATLKSLRVEQFANRPWGDNGVRTWYVVTKTIQLDEPIRYDKLTLISKQAPLAPNFSRGYGMVWLPDDLTKWYEDCLERHSRLLSLSNEVRWDLFY